MDKFRPFRGSFVARLTELIVGVSINQNIVQQINNGANQGLRFDAEHAVYTGRVNVPRWENNMLRVPKGLLPKEDYT